MLRLNGYSTAAFGKSHETAAWEVSPSGPTDRWPTRSGFDKFYGFIGGETNQWAPAIYEDMSRIEVPKDPNYHFMTDMTNQAIKWTSAQKSLTPDKPFFTYFAPGATHAPHHAPKEWIAKYKGKFDQGWDKLREETLARQIKLGVVPAGTKLAPKPEAIKDWDKLSADEKKLFARQMEVFAGFGEYTDYEIGRLIQAIEDLGQLDNTLIFYEVGDNGASAEGTMNGLFNEMTYFNGIPETVADILKHYDDLGGPNSYPHYAAGWAVAGDTPFTWTKQVAGSYGGTPQPAGRPLAQGDQGQGRGAVAVASRHRHRADHPRSGRPARAEVGERHAADAHRRREHGLLVRDAKAKDRHKTQYFEIFGNRGIYHDGWLAHTVHRAAWERQAAASVPRRQVGTLPRRRGLQLGERPGREEPREAQGVAGSVPEGSRRRTTPCRSTIASLERYNAALVGRPDLMAGRTSLTVYEGMIGMTENVFINTKNRSHTITAEVTIPKGGANGVILSQAGRFGGWSLYVKDGKPMYTYNFLGLSSSKVASPKALPEGKVTIRYEFKYDGGGLGKGGTGTIFVNGEKVAEGKIDRTQANVFSADEGADVGQDGETPVTDDYKEGDNKFPPRGAGLYIRRSASSRLRCANPIRA